MTSPDHDRDDPIDGDSSARTSPVLPLKVRRFYASTVPLACITWAIIAAGCLGILSLGFFMLPLTMLYGFYLLFAGPFSFSACEGIARQPWTRRWSALVCGTVVAVSIHSPAPVAFCALLYFLSKLSSFG